MDFAQLHKGAAALIAGVVASINLAVVPPSSPPPLQTPTITDSFNLPDKVRQSETTNVPFNALNVITSQEDLSLKMVVKEVKAAETVTVDQPPVVYTVAEPTPKPTASPETAPSSLGYKDSLAPEDIKVKSGDVSSPSNKEIEVTKLANPSPSPSASPSQSITPVAAGNANSELLFQMANDYRAKLGLKAFEKDEKICKMTEARASQVNGELQSGTLHKGFKDLNLSYWATENIAAYNTIGEDFNFWVSDYIHKKALESDNKYSCVACAGASCSQIFTSFVSK